MISLDLPAELESLALKQLAKEDESVHNHEDDWQDELNAADYHANNVEASMYDRAERG